MYKKSITHLHKGMLRKWEDAYQKINSSCKWKGGGRVEECVDSERDFVPQNAYT